MLFYLDKELAKQGIAKCIAVSEKEISQEELEARKKFFNVKEILIYEGIDIPHKFKYNEKLDTIEEVIEIIEDTPQTLSNGIEEVESEFDESVEIEPEVYYFYIDKEIADKFYVAETITTFRKPVLDPDTYFTKPTYMIKGKHTPYYITVEDGVVREATEYEKYTRGQRKLTENEAILKENIIILEPGQYIDEEKEEIITIPCSPEYLVKEWDKKNHIWKDLTTDLDRVQAQYRDYKSLDTPLSFIEMEEQGIKDEYVSMMKELQDLTVTLEAQKDSGIRALTVDIVKPSEKLEAFKNKFKKFF